MSAEQSPKIVIVDESPIRAAILLEGLREAGFTGVVHINEMQSLLSRIYPDRPGKPQPRRAGADVPGQPGGAAADRNVRRPE
jgi:hypothetical protein